MVVVVVAVVVVAAVAAHPTLGRVITAKIMEVELVVAVAVVVVVATMTIVVVEVAMVVVELVRAKETPCGHRTVEQAPPRRSRRVAVHLLRGGGAPDRA